MGAEDIENKETEVLPKNNLQACAVIIGAHGLARSFYTCTLMLIIELDQ
jgi:hypothetical protein